jgi:hypothetical protein
MRESPRKRLHTRTLPVGLHVLAKRRRSTLEKRQPVLQVNCYGYNSIMQLGGAIRAGKEMY